MAAGIDADLALLPKSQGHEFNPPHAAGDALCRGMRQTDQAQAPGISYKPSSSKPNP